MKRLVFLLGFLVLGASLSAMVNSAHGQSPKAAPDAVLKGSSGLPLPRFVSLKFDRTNVRKGPSVTHQVAWVFARKGLPVEIIAEFDHWRRVRDSEGEEGWVYYSLLTGRRTAIVAPWRKGERLELFSEARGKSTAIAIIEAGTLGSVGRCTGKWCRFGASGYDGWMKQDLLWGVYPGEQLK